MVCRLFLVLSWLVELMNRKQVNGLGVNVEAQLFCEMALFFPQISLRCHPWNSLCWSGILPKQMTKTTQNNMYKNNYHAFMCQALLWGLPTIDMVFSALWNKTIFTPSCGRINRHQEVSPPASRWHSSSATAEIWTWEGCCSIHILSTIKWCL